MIDVGNLRDMLELADAAFECATEERISRGWILGTVAISRAERSPPWMNRLFLPN